MTFIEHNTYVKLKLNLYNEMRKVKGWNRQDFNSEYVEKLKQGKVK